MICTITYFGILLLNRDSQINPWDVSSSEARSIRICRWCRKGDCFFFRYCKSTCAKTSCCWYALQITSCSMLSCLSSGKCLQTIQAHT